MSEFFMDEMNNWDADDLAMSTASQVVHGDLGPESEPDEEFGMIEFN